MRRVIAAAPCGTELLKQDPLRCRIRVARRSAPLQTPAGPRRPPPRTPTRRRSAPAGAAVVAMRGTRGQSGRQVTTVRNRSDTCSDPGAGAGWWTRYPHASSSQCPDTSSRSVQHLQNRVARQFRHAGGPVGALCAGGGAALAWYAAALPRADWPRRSRNASASCRRPIAASRWSGTARPLQALQPGLGSGRQTRQPARCSRASSN